MRPAPQETRAVNHIRLSGQNRIEKERVFLWVVLEVRVLDQDNISGGGLEAAPQRSALPSICRVANDNVRDLSQAVFDDVTCPIRRAIIHNDDLEIGNC